MQMPVTDTNSRAYRLRWWTMAVLALSLVIVVIDNSILNVALPTMQRDLEATVQDLQWMVDSYILVSGSLFFIMGSLGDRFGHATALRTGMITFAAASVFAMTADSASVVIAARSIMGIGAALIMPATMAVIMNVFPPDERGKAIGIWGAMAGVGIALGPITGGLLLEYFSWASIFFINVPIAIIALSAGVFLVPNSRNPHPGRLDPLGTALSAGALGILIYGLIKGGEWGWTDPIVIGCLAGAMLIGGLFVLWERNNRAPLLDMALFRNRRFSIGAAGITLNMLGHFGIVFALTLYMQFVLGYSALETGVRFLPIAAGVMLGSGTSHRYVTAFGTTRTVGIAFVSIVALLAGASFWEIDTPYWILALVFFAWGFAVGNINTANVDAVVGAIPLTQAGVGSAINSVAVQVGGAIGVAGLGSILSGQYTSNIEPELPKLADLPPGVVEAAKESVGGATMAAGQLPPEVGEVVRATAHNSFMDGWQIMVWVACGVAAIATVMVFRFMPPRPSQQPEVHNIN